MFHVTKKKKRLFYSTDTQTKKSHKMLLYFLTYFFLASSFSFLVQASTFLGFDFVFFNTTDGSCGGNETSHLSVEFFGCSPFIANPNSTDQFFAGNASLEYGGFYCTDTLALGICVNSSDCSSGCVEKHNICLHHESNNTQHESNTTVGNTTQSNSFDFLISCNMFTRTTQPTGSPSVSPTHFGPTAAPVTSIPSLSPVISSPTETPTFSPVSSLPTQSPITSSPTASPTVSPSKLPTFHPSKQPSLSPSTAAPIAAPPFCFHPSNDIGYFQCRNRIALCATWGILMKYVVHDTCSAIGSSFPENEQLYGGSCQCDDFCAYSCERACSLDQQCYWLNGACYQQISDLPGSLTISQTCSQTVAPTLSPTLSTPTAAPTTTQPSSSPSLSPTSDPTATPTAHPVPLASCTFPQGNSCYDIPSCPQGGNNCYCFLVPGTSNQGICGQQYDCESLSDCNSNADCKQQENCLETCCGSYKCVPQECGDSGVGRLLDKTQRKSSAKGIPCKSTTTFRCYE